MNRISLDLNLAWCDNLTIDYGASGEIIVAEGGVPQGVKLTMSFKELEIQTAEDYQS